MNIIKLSILSVIMYAAFSVQAESLSGIVNIKGKVPKGTLYIFAKKFGSAMPMPLAVQRIESPKYPVKFMLDESKKMIPSIPFKGPFVIVARISPSGSAMDKTGVEVKTSKPISLGAKDIQLTLIGNQ
ncbi:hypothetical protein A9Q84_14705 [Halobacteriovorax marinus]|uniref:Cytochrome c-type biogenesis protein H Ig-like domain-containing protein n=1 Tax=Halobacteriovorax marinus TaxID=97084 RepID=A0A1Y5F5I0_9BACT|nr:hypothetical protein A9Q84_14705 [Halobacteriovorax marinus]